MKICKINTSMKLVAAALLFSLSHGVYAATVFKLAYAENSEPVKQALQYIGQSVEQKTHGEVQIQYFPDSQLGGERELVEMTQVGAIDLTKVSSGLLESFSPLYGVFSLPYLFKNQEEFYKVMDDPDIMDPVYQSTETQGFIGMGWYDSGARSFYMSKGPVKSIDDLKGKKIRVMQSETSINTMKLLGASPIAMSQAEVYTSLQQGIIDGAENNEFALTIARHGEVAKYYTYDMHTRIPDIVIMSSLTKTKLTPDQMKALQESIHESVEVEKKAWKEEMDKTRDLAKSQFGVQFFNIDYAPFKKAVQPIYEKLKSKPQVYALYQKISQVSQ
ncbi:TRAP transporter substrate-binding protein [Pectobacteriaceae bacterium C111]|nr:TRAP transporter substrate-binding protein [Pectobacteriaceae bacterium C111]